jgi:DNA adenine methylase
MKTLVTSHGAEAGDLEPPNRAASAKPFLKWAGGKRWLCTELRKFLPISFNCYFEPFLGGAAIFFELAPPCATLSDVNEDLINAFTCVRNNVEETARRLRILPVNEKTYAFLRKHIPSDDIDRAVRLIYLTKTAFNGLYRVNRQGEFNVPFAGYQGRTIFAEDQLRTAALLLSGCKLVARDFEHSFSETQEGDLIYCDPPYTVRHSHNGFIRYNEALFSWKDQRRLAAAANGAVRRGVYVLVSNAKHASVRKLYKTFTAKTLTRASCMSGNVSRRGATSEFLLIGDPNRI